VAASLYKGNDMNWIIKGLIGLLAVGFTVVTTLCTWHVASSIPSGEIASHVVGIMGVGMDLSKAILIPLGIKLLIEKIWLQSAISLILGIGLLFISLAATVSFLETEEQQVRKTASSNSYAEESKRLRLELAKQDMETGKYRGRALSNLEKADKLNARQEQKKQSVSGTTLGRLASLYNIAPEKLRGHIWLLGAIIIDILPLFFFTLLALSSKTRNQDVTSRNQHQERRKETKKPQEQKQEAKKAFVLVPNAIHETKDLILYARELITKGDVLENGKVKINPLKKALGTGYDKARVIIQQLEKEQFLRRDGRSYIPNA